ncbi:hypothetical protein SHJG_5474 [Streptomyces hygroscopicus subsp. jinggangensis 5008]|nr:hypothetical protein SHJG_5474 [Streptomyces hygroscopicus subsp. jinggangensis 5008]AGF64900.1 hypothetical protein SHJGH_5237 [Streptomyces hygroscopicus subsp. jinggangensis TL01]
MTSMAHSNQRPPVDFTPTTLPRQFRSLDEQIEAIIDALPEVVPAALKATVPSAREGIADAFIANMIVRLRAFGARQAIAAQQA